MSYLVEIKKLGNQAFHVDVVSCHNFAKRIDIPNIY